MTKSDTIKQTVAEFFGLTVEALVGPSRKARIAGPRLVAYLMFREFTDCSLPTIAQKMERSDHTTVMSGLRSIPEKISRDEDLSDRVDAIREALTNTFNPIPFMRRSQRAPEFRTTRKAA